MPGQSGRAGDAGADGEGQRPPGHGEPHAAPGGPHQHRRRQSQPQQGESHHGDPVDDREGGEGAGVGAGHRPGSHVRERVHRGGGLAEGAQDQEQRRSEDQGEGAADDQPAEDQGEQQQGGEQAEAEHGVAAEQHGLAGLAGGEVGDEQGAERRGDHGGDHGEQPDRGGLVGLDLVADHHQVGDGHGGEEACRGAGGEQDGVHGDGGGNSDEVLADDEGAAADGQQGHGEAAVERGHGGVQEVGAGLVAVVEPVAGPGGQQDGEGGGGQHPEDLADHALAGELVREGRAGVGDDRGAHDAGVPVGAEVTQGGSLVGSGAGGPGGGGTGAYEGGGHGSSVPPGGAGRQRVRSYEGIN